MRFQGRIRGRVRSISVASAGFYRLRVNRRSLSCAVIVASERSIGVRAGCSTIIIRRRTGRGQTESWFHCSFVGSTTEGAIAVVPNKSVWAIAVVGNKFAWEIADNGIQPQEAERLICGIVQV